MANRPGPHTDAGKAASARNATKHGLTSLHPVVTAEDRPHFDALRDNLFHAIQPTGYLQDHAFQRLLLAAWNMQRCLQLEHQLLATAAGADPLGHPGAQQQAALFQRYYLRFEGSYRANLRELQRLQRLAGDLSQNQQLAKRTPAAPQPAPYPQAPLNQHTAKRTPPAAPQSLQNPQTPLNQHAAKRTPPTPPPTARNAPCPCGSTKKYKRCCGVDAPPVLCAA